MTISDNMKKNKTVGNFTLSWLCCHFHEREVVIVLLVAMPWWWNCVIIIYASTDQGFRYLLL